MIRCDALCKFHKNGLCSAKEIIIHMRGEYNTPVCITHEDN